MQKSVAMVCSFCPGGQVADRCLYDSHPQTDNDTMLRWARDVAAGLRAMHAAGVTHRNLTPRNVHLDARGRAVSAGSMILKTPRAPGDPYSLGRADCGTASVIAPEVEDGHPVTPASDVGPSAAASSPGRAPSRSCPRASARPAHGPRAAAGAQALGAKVRSAIRMCLQHHPDRASADELGACAPDGRGKKGILRVSRCDRDDER